MNPFSKIVLLTMVSLPAYSGDRLTIYGSGGQANGYAIINHTMSATLETPKSQLLLNDLPQTLDPLSVFLQPQHPESDLTILEQNYRNNLTDLNTLLNQYLGKNITVEQITPQQMVSYQGTLLSIQNGLLLKQADNTLIHIQDYANVQFPKFDKTPRVKPALEWSISTQKNHTTDLQVTYQAYQIGWSAEYQGIYKEKNAQGGDLTVNTWANLSNQSGMDYPGAKITLVSGQINQTSSRNQPEALMMMSKMADAPNTQEQPVFEYYQYPIDEPIDLPNSTLKQVHLLSAFTIPVQKTYIFEDLNPYAGYVNRNPNTNNNTPSPITTYLTFKNGQKETLPSGKMRVYDNTQMTFIGEDNIAPTPKNQEVILKMGQAFDLSAKKIQTDYFIDQNRKIIRESFEIQLNNSKKESAKITVKQNLNRSNNWKITQNSQSFKKVDAQSIEFIAVVKPNTPETISYTVEYTW